MIKEFRLSGMVYTRDFDQTFKEGSYLFKGPIGSGKTTVLDSLHPFDTFISRDLSVRDVMKPGGTKEIVLTRHSDEYLVRIHKNKKGVSDEFFIRKNGSKLLLTTKVTLFKETIDAIFMPDKWEFLQLHSDMVPLSKLKNADLKELMLRLAGNDQFEQVRTFVKSKTDSLASSVVSLKGQLLGLTNNKIGAQITETTEELAQTRKQLEEEKELLDQKLITMEQHRITASSLLTQQTRAESKLSGVLSEKGQIEEALPRIQLTRKQLSALEPSEQRLEAIEAKVSSLDEMERSLGFEDQLSEVKDELKEIGRRIALSDKYKDVPCKEDLKTACPLVPKQLDSLEDLHDTRAELEQKRAQIEEQKKTKLEKIEKGRSSLRLEQNSLKKEIRRLRSIRDEILRFEGGEEKLPALTHKEEVLTAELGEIRRKLQECPFSATEIAETQQRAQTVAGLLSTCLHKQELVQQLSSQEETKTAISTKLKDIGEDFDAFTVLTKVFSMNEYPAMVLLDIIKNVVEQTNTLLQMFYPEFSISIGLKEDARQTVEIFVRKNGSPRAFALLSTGEKAWIDRFVRIAFGLITNSSHGFLDILCCDEGDGVMHQSVREAFLKVHTHLLGKVPIKQLFIVSHDPRAEKIFDNVVEF